MYFFTSLLHAANTTKLGLTNNFKKSLWILDPKDLMSSKFSIQHVQCFVLASRRIKTVIQILYWRDKSSILDTFFSLINFLTMTISTSKCVRQNSITTHKIFYFKVAEGSGFGAFSLLSKVSLTKKWKIKQFLFKFIFHKREYYAYFFFFAKNAVHPWPVITLKNTLLIPVTVKVQITVARFSCIQNKCDLCCFRSLAWIPDKDLWERKGLIAQVAHRSW